MKLSPAGRLCCPDQELKQETAMGTNDRVARIGMDIQRTFSQVTARDEQQRLLWTISSDCCGGGPPPVVRQQREWLRYRLTLVQLQTGLKNRVHAILQRHGLFPEVVLDRRMPFLDSGRRSVNAVRNL
jgi:hypothetical protein